ncbi:NADH-quinone oxidoreductase subunit K [Arenibaculum sp.]|uniref:NADH-quinone oxidoreductase subunit K n=1 Tax=Arenibaculum sp. TaxID=2865862 RepID=UPI002E153EEB|nr:NADH-quinone oxidoreductase subunit K [Arenibaculum sp.]
MTQGPFFALVGIGLVALGVHGLLARRHLVRQIVAFNVLGSGIFLVFGGLARRAPEAGSDPVPHALAITGIVVALSATALALTLALRLHRATGRVSLPRASADPDP